MARLSVTARKHEAFGSDIIVCCDPRLCDDDLVVLEEVLLAMGRKYPRNGPKSVKALRRAITIPIFR